MNFIFVSPHFPKTYWNFCDRLHRNGVNVLGIGDAPFDEIPWELKQCLTEYYRVNDLGNYDEMLRAVAYFTFHYGKIDWIESNNEYWLEMDAQLRTDFNINTGAKNDFIERIKYKSKMKESYIAAGVPVARHHIVSTLAEARAFIKEVGYPGYSTAAGWLGYSDEKMIRLAKQETEIMGFKQIKLKVGQNLKDDLRRLKLAREAVGPDIAIAVDANQVWDVPQAIEWISKFKDYDLAWVEEPTCPDDILGHATIQKAIDPIPVATGEQMQNRVMYKQYLQAGGFKVMQIDATRVAGPQEIILEYLLAKKFGVKVCPHAGGVGLCEAIIQLAMFDYVSVSGEMEDRVVEYVDNQHEYFVHPTVIRDGRYVAPLAPGNGTEMKLNECMRYLHRN